MRNRRDEIIEKITDSEEPRDRELVGMGARAGFDAAIEEVRKEIALIGEERMNYTHILPEDSIVTKSIEIFARRLNKFLDSLTKDGEE